MSEPSENNTNSAKKPPADRRIKLAFLAALVIGGGVVWLIQVRSTPLEGWGNDLDAALVKAREENRSVVALFESDPPGAITRRLKSDVISKRANREAVTRGGFIRVEIALDTSLSSETARRFKIRRLPTLLVIGPDGQERNRREGNVGEMDFREGFLDCTKIMRPEDFQ